MISLWNKETKEKKDDTKCIFIITRGDKMGEKCGNKVKKDSYCQKHYKEDKKEEEKVECKSENEPVNKAELIELKYRQKDTTELKLHDSIDE